jgi:hypothetical protein
MFYADLQGSAASPGHEAQEAFVQVFDAALAIPQEAEFGLQ